MTGHRCDNAGQKQQDFMHLCINFLECVKIGFRTSKEEKYSVMISRNECNVLMVRAARQCIPDTQLILRNLDRKTDLYRWYRILPFAEDPPSSAEGRQVQKPVHGRVFFRSIRKVRARFVLYPLIQLRLVLAEDYTRISERFIVIDKYGIAVNVFENRL